MGARGDIEPVGLDQTGSERKASALKNTFGWTRIDVCGAVSNICFLSALCFSVVVDSLQVSYCYCDLRKFSSFLKALK